jgi:hypothetical protein
MDTDTCPVDGSAMDRTVASLLRDLLRFIADERSYVEVMEAWRTSCPRLPIWEEATEHGLVKRVRDESGLPVVRVTAAGRAFLLGHSPSEARSAASLASTRVSRSDW